MAQSVVSLRGIRKELEPSSIYGFEVGTLLLFHSDLDCLFMDFLATCNFSETLFFDIYMNDPVSHSFVNYLV